MTTLPGLGASLVAQLVKNLPAVQETWVRSLGAGRLSGTVSPFRAEQGTSLETPSRARASSCQEVGTTWFL